MIVKIKSAELRVRKREEKDEKKEGEKELIFLKVSPDPAAGRFALEFASSR